MRRSAGPGAHSFVRVMKHPVGWVARHGLDGNFSGREHLPKSGPYVVAANHLSLVDPVFVTLTVGELVQYLALDELFGQAKYLDEILYYFGSIPLSRERAPLGALQHALDLLDQGEIVGVFPEGARALHWGERVIKRGAAWLSMATGVPLVPVAIIGTEATLSLSEPGVHIPSIRVSIHPPLFPGSYIEHEDPLRAMMDDWTAVLDNQLTHWIQKDNS